MSTPAIPRTRWRGVALKGLLLVVALLAVCASIEHLLEVRAAARLTASDTFFTAPDRRVRYHETGLGNPGPTVVLINGLAACLEQWDGVQAALSTVSPVISYDRGGAGFSDRTNAQDANAEADELDQLLHYHRIAGPFVLVSYSSSSMMASVFAARHLDVVKGIVFVDPAPLWLPALPAPGTKTYRRVFWRFNVVALQAFFGYTRLRVDMEGPEVPLTSPALERINEAVKSTHHWLASAHEAMSLDESAYEADAALATRPFAHLPLGVLSTMDPTESEYIREVLERQKKLAASSEQGVMRALHRDHNRLMQDPVAIGSVVDLIHTVVDEARAKPAAGAGS